MDWNTIKRELRKGERVTLECKKATTEVPKSIWETYSAFANTIGGLILLGVEEHQNETSLSKRFEFVGVMDVQKILTDFWNTINGDKVNANILTDSNIEVMNVDGKQIVCIQVPMADWRTKPVYLNGNVYKGTFRRNHEGDYHCTEEQVKAMIRDACSEGNDGVLMEYYGLDDIDPVSLRQYRTEFRQENSTHVWNQDDDKTFLRNLGGYTEDRQTGKEGLTLAGLMMFGKGLAIRDRFANFRMDYLDMSHLLKGERYHDRLTYDGLWENNLYQFFRIVSPKVQFDLPRPFKLEKGGRRNDDTPQHEAVREAFTNAIIHCDLLMDAGILRVEKHDDHICFRNPGLLKLPLESIYRGGNSKARNPKIQNMLRMIGYGENLGSGFPKIVAAWKQTDWGEPQLLNKIDVDEVELVLPVPIINDEDTNDIPKEESEWLSNNLSNNLSENLSENLSNNLSNNLSKKLSNRLSKNAVNILKMINKDRHISREELAEKVGLSVVAVQNHINKLKSVGMIKRVGSSRQGYWEVSDKKDNGSLEQDSVNAITVQKESATVQKESATVQKESATVQKESATAQKESATAQKKSGTAQKESSTAQKKSGTAQKELATTQKKSATAQKESATAQKGTATAQKESATTQKDSATAQKKSATVQRESSTTQKKSATAPKETATAQKGSSTAPKETATAPKESATAQKESSTAQKESGTTQKGTATAQKESGTVQKESGTAQKKSDTVQKESATAQKESATTQKELTTAQKAILDYLSQHPDATRQGIAQALGNISESGVKFNIARLLKLGLLTREGGRKTGLWIVLASKNDSQ